MSALIISSLAKFLQALLHSNKSW